MRKHLILLVGLLALAAVPADGALVGHWEFDDAGNVGAATVGDGLEVVGNAAYDASGRAGGALLLDGDGDYLRLNDTYALPTGVPYGNGAYTVAAFIKTDIIQSNGIVGWGAATSGRFNGSRTGQPGGGSSAYVNYGWGPAYDIVKDVDYSDGAWHHYAATFDPATGEKTLYFDGAKMGAGMVVGSLDVAAENFRLGTIHHPYGDEDFSGMLDDVRIYDNALAPADIAAMAASPVPPANLVAHWSFDNPTDVGAATVGDDLEAVGEAGYAVGGKVGGALALDGDGDYLRLDANDTLPADIPIGDEGYSITAFFKSDVVSRNGIVGWGVGGVSRYNGARTGEWGAEPGTPGSTQTIMSANWGGTGYDAIRGVEYTDGEWHHYAVTFNPGTREKIIYLDGVQLGGPEIIYQLNVAAENFRVGTMHYGYDANQVNEFFDGMIDELCIYDGPLTAEEVAALAAAGSQSLTGDLNGDGMVGSADLDIVRANWGTFVTPGDLLSGDPSGDGAVGSADLDIIRANWGATSVATVPEPCLAMLLLSAAASIVAFRAAKVA